MKIIEQSDLLLVLFFLGKYSRYKSKLCLEGLKDPRVTRRQSKRHGISLFLSHHSTMSPGLFQHVRLRDYFQKDPGNLKLWMVSKITVYQHGFVYIEKKTKKGNAG